MRFLPLAILSLLAAPAVTAQSEATYRVTFESTWSAQTHPDGFPADPHYSGLVGATHDEGASLWAPDMVASRGIEVMAESGSKSALLSEVSALQDDGHVGQALSGGNLSASPGSMTMTFDVSEAYPLVSLVTMIAPSPDWFVGVHGLELFGGGTWVSEVVVPLVVYDAGTDSGTDYTSPNDDTDPAEPIAQLTGAPFLVDGEVPPVGTFTFTRLSSTSSGDRAAEAGFSLSRPAPNPSVGPVAVALHADAAQAVRVEVFDLLGRRALVVYAGAVQQGTRRFEVPAGALTPGAYVIRARGAENVALRRFVIAR